MNRDTRIILAFLLSLFLLLMLFVGTARGEEFSPPLRDYIVTSDFGFRGPVMGGEDEDLLHRGLDLAPIGQDQNVYASADGIVCVHYPAPDRRFRGHAVLGGMITIRHQGGAFSLYGHMSRTFVHEGQWIERGQVIGIVGATGRATGRHLHFEVLYDPARILLDSSAILNRREFEKKLLCK